MPFPPTYIPAGIAFPHRHARELVHLRPLVSRLQDLMAVPPPRAHVAVLASPRHVSRRHWSVQVFQGLADRHARSAHTLQRRGLVVRLFGSKSSTSQPTPRRGRYRQVNAFGPRWADLQGTLLEGTVVSRHGHVPLNELDGLRADPEGPVAWLPAQEPQGAAAAHAFAGDILRLAERVPVLVQLPAHGGRRGRQLRRRLERTPAVTLAPAHADPYPLLEGARALLSGPGGLGLDAFCAGLPVALLHLLSDDATGLQLELADRVPTFGPGKAGLADWAEAPAQPGDTGWCRDLMFEPRRNRNDAFAAELRQKAVELAL